MILLENIGKKEVASAMVFNENNIAKRNKSVQNAKINIDLPTLNILCRYILQDPKIIRMEHLVNLRRLLYLIDTSMYENDVEKVKRVNFIKKALEARLDYGLTDIDIIQLEINSKYRDPDNLKLLERLIKSLEKFIKQYNEYINR